MLNSVAFFHGESLRGFYSFRRIASSISGICEIGIFMWFPSGRSAILLASVCNLGTTG